MYCANCGKEIPEGGSLCANCGAPSGQRSGLKRTGIIVALSVVATVLVVAGIGAGLWFGLRGDGETASAAGSDVSVTSTATIASDSFGSVGPEDGFTQDSDDVFSSEGGIMDYINAVTRLLGEIEFYNVRVSELAEIISADGPDTPTDVHDELTAIADSVSIILGDLNHILIPAGFQDSDYWVKLAGAHMLSRVQATIDGIEAMWDTGSAASATPFLEREGAEHDAYLEAIGAYYLGTGST